MQRGFRLLVASVLVVSAVFVVRADVIPSQAAEVQLQLGDLLLCGGKLFRNPWKRSGTRRAWRRPIYAQARRRPHPVGAAVRRVRRSAPDRGKAHPGQPPQPGGDGGNGDTLWASGLFEQAEAKYRDALAAARAGARAPRAGQVPCRPRANSCRAMNEAQAALRLSPRDLEIHHTVGTIYERMHKYEEAATAYSNYINLLPNKDTSAKALRGRARRSGSCSRSGSACRSRPNPALTTRCSRFPSGW